MTKCLLSNHTSDIVVSRMSTFMSNLLAKMAATNYYLCKPSARWVTFNCFSSIPNYYFSYSSLAEYVD